MAKTREQIEMALFVLECKDHWDNKDWIEYNNLRKELERL